MIALEHERCMLRWGGSLATVLAVHAVLIGVVLWWQTRPAPPPLPMPAEAVMVEMAPLPTAPPAPPSELPPGPPQQEQRKAQPKPQPEPKPEPAPQRHEAEVALPQQVQQQASEDNANVDVEQTSAPPSVQAPTGSQYAAQQTLSGATFQATASWQSQLLGHLEHFRRYPRAAIRRRQQGTVQVQFSIDRKGNVLSVSLAHGSGHTPLDSEALATVRRASPLPPPPDDIPGDPVMITTPVDFSLNRI